MTFSRISYVGYFLSALCVTYLLMIFLSKDTTTVLVREQTKDIGVIDDVSDAHAEFVLVNVGETRLNIDAIVPDCLCTIPSWSDKSTTPNDSIVVRVNYDSEPRSFFQQNIKVYCNVENSPIILTFTGEFEKKN